MIATAEPMFSRGRGIPNQGRARRRLARAFMAIVPAWAILPTFMLPSAMAHPLSNDHIEHFSILTILPDRVELDLLLDIAENPAAAIRTNQIDADGDGEDTEQEQRAWLAARATEFISALPVALNGQPLAWEVVPDVFDTRTRQATPTKIILKNPGFLGMPTYRLMIRYAAAYPAPLPEGRHVLEYENRLYPDHPGLQRILLAPSPASVVLLEPRPVRIDEGPDPFLYENYDPDRLPHERKTSIVFEIRAAVGPDAPPGAGDMEMETAGDPHAVETPALPAYLQSLNDPRNDPAQTRSYYRQADRLVNLLRGRWSLAAVLMVAGFSFVWGAAHALAPGHAKTVVAAYLLSRRGSFLQVVFLAVVVTMTHTALVVLLGVVIWFYQRSHPEIGPTLQLWLGLSAGMLVAAMGLMLIWRAWKQRRASGPGHHAHDHDHAPRSGWRALFHHSHPDPEQWVPQRNRPGHEHEHHHEHEHERAHAGSAHDEALSYRLLLFLGVAGGIVPCPTATIILLLGIGANILPGALFAVGVFSLGLAMTLTVVGLLAVTGRRFVKRWLSDAEKDDGRLSARGHRLLHVALPAAGGLAVVTLGLLISGNYVFMLLGGRPLFDWL